MRFSGTLKNTRKNASIALRFFSDYTRSSQSIWSIYLRRLLLIIITSHISSNKIMTSPLRTRENGLLRTQKSLSELPPRFIMLKKRPCRSQWDEHLQEREIQRENIILMEVIIRSWMKHKKRPFISIAMSSGRLLDKRMGMTRKASIRLPIHRI